MNCKEQMRVKLKIMTLLGFNKQFINNYCYSIPQQKTTNIRALIKLKQILLRYEKHKITHEYFLDLFFSDETCPYCQTAKKYCESCTDCAYGKIYGMCANTFSNYQIVIQNTCKITTIFKTEAALLLLTETIEEYRRSKQNEQIKNHRKD